MSISNLMITMTNLQVHLATAFCLVFLFIQPSFNHRIKSIKEITFHDSDHVVEELSSCDHDHDSDRIIINTPTNCDCGHDRIIINTTPTCDCDLEDLSLPPITFHQIGKHLSSSPEYRIRQSIGRHNDRANRLTSLGTLQKLYESSKHQPQAATNKLPTLNPSQDKADFQISSVPNRHQPSNKESKLEQPLDQSEIKALRKLLEKSKDLSQDSTNTGDSSVPEHRPNDEVSQPQRKTSESIK